MKVKYAGIVVLGLVIAALAVQQGDKQMTTNKLMIKPQVGKIQVTVGLLKNLAFSDLDCFVRLASC